MHGCSPSKIIWAWFAVVQHEILGIYGEGAHKAWYAFGGER